MEEIEEKTDAEKQKTLQTSQEQICENKMGQEKGWRRILLTCCGRSHLWLH